MGYDVLWRSQWLWHSFRLSRRNGVWNETWLYSFKGGADGSGPIGTLASDSAGDLYGTTSDGGAACSCGTIFKLILSGGRPVYSIVHRFNGPPGAGFAYNGMTPDSTGSNLYGANVHGGPTNDGTIYRLVP